MDSSEARKCQDGHLTYEQPEGRCAICGEQVEPPVQPLEYEQTRIEQPDE
jgi:hypothetical protein